MSSRFERVSRVEIEPNELRAYAKNIGTLNKLTLGILEKFARVSFRFSMLRNFTTSKQTLLYQHKINPHFHPFLPPHKSTQIIGFQLVTTSHYKGRWPPTNIISQGE